MVCLQPRKEKIIFVTGSKSQLFGTGYLKFWNFLSFKFITISIFSDVRYSQWNQNSSDWYSSNWLCVGPKPAPRAEWVISANTFSPNQLNTNCTNDLGSTCPLILSSTTNKCQPKKTLASTATIKSMVFMRRLSLAVKWVRNIQMCPWSALYWLWNLFAALSSLLVRSSIRFYLRQLHSFWPENFHLSFCVRSRLQKLLQILE